MNDVRAIATPKCEADQFVVVGQRNFRQAIKPRTDAREVPRRQVISEVRIAVASLPGLFGRKIAALGDGDCVDARFALSPSR